MLRTSDGFDRLCQAPGEPKVAAIVNGQSRITADLRARRHASDISIHGDADTLVPYQHSVRLQEALQKAGIPHEL